MSNHSNTYLKFVKSLWIINSELKLIRASGQVILIVLSLISCQQRWYQWQEQQSPSLKYRTWVKAQEVLGPIHHLYPPCCCLCLQLVYFWPTECWLTRAAAILVAFYSTTTTVSDPSDPSTCVLPNCTNNGDWPTPPLLGHPLFAPQSRTAWCLSIVLYLFTSNKNKYA